MKAKDLINILSKNPEAEVLIHDFYMGEFDDTGTNNYSGPVLGKLPDERLENVIWYKENKGNYIVLTSGGSVLFSWDKEDESEERCEACGLLLENCTCDFSDL